MGKLTEIEKMAAMGATYFGRALGKLDVGL